MNNEVVEHQINTNDNVFYSVQNQTHNSTVASAAPIWEEDFANGFPSGWSSYTNNTQGGFATCPWVHSFDGSWGYYQGTHRNVRSSSYKFNNCFKWVLNF